MTTTASRDVAAPFEAAHRSRGLVFVLGMLVALGPFTIDLYLPALPTIADQLHTTSSAAQLTLTGTLAGLGVGQLVIGPLSDAFGRRRPLLVGTVLHVVASLLCVVAPDVVTLGVFRVLQGLGAAAASVVAMAVVRDLYDGIRAARVLSRLILILGASPVLAPTIGGLLLGWTDWRGVFVGLAVLGLAITVLAALGLPETLAPERRLTGGARGTVRTYGHLLTDRTFVALVLVAGASMAAIFAYVSGSPFVLQEQYGMSERAFGIVFAVNAVAIIGASQVNVRLLSVATPAQILVGSLATAVVGGVALVGAAVADIGGAAGLLVPLFLVLGAVGLAGPNAPALALSLHGESAGTAAALLGAVQFGVGALSAPLVGALGNDNLALAAVVAGSTVVAAVLLVVGVRVRVLHAIEVDETEVVVGH